MEDDVFRRQRCGAGVEDVLLSREDNTRSCDDDLPRYPSVRHISRASRYLATAYSQSIMYTASSAYYSAFQMYLAT